MAPGRTRWAAPLAATLLGAALAAGCGQHRPVPAALPAAKPSTTTQVAAPPTTGPATTAVVPPTATTGPTASTATSAPTATTTTSAGTSPPAFSSSVSQVSAADLGASYRPGCPMGPDQLRLIHLSYWGFDQARHLGDIVVNQTVVQDVITIFAALYAEHFPIRQMQPVAAFQGSDPASMAADNTSGFNCRYAVAAGPPHWSVHAFGEAIDVNTVENPYIEGGTVQPPAGVAFVNRSLVRPGMAVPGGPLVGAFASVGWWWGGRWATPDYQHFSKTGG